MQMSFIKFGLLYYASLLPRNAYKALWRPSWAQKLNGQNLPRSAPARPPGGPPPEALCFAWFRASPFCGPFRLRGRRRTTPSRFLIAIVERA